MHCSYTTDDHRVTVDILDATRNPGWTVLMAPVDRHWYSPATAKNARRGKKSSNPSYNAGKAANGVNTFIWLM